MGQHPLSDNLPYRHPRIQGRIGILENQLQIAAQEPHLIISKPGEINPVIPVCFNTLKLFVFGIRRSHLVDLFQDGSQFSLDGDNLVLRFFYLCSVLVHLFLPVIP